MKPSISKRIISAVLVLCTLLALFPALQAVEANAVGFSTLTCSDFISNETARKYIDTMMQYYLNNNSKLRNTLDDGLSVIFMFEGGSDHYREYGSTYANNSDDIRNQSVVIVVQKNSAGNAYVDFWAENCSSIPGDPSWCTGAAYSGSTTILDGIYPFYTTNHTGPYAALQLDMSATNGYGYYTPTWDPDGFKNGASGINIHTRSTNIAAGEAKGWAWSEGCQVISSGPTYYDNYFNEFMQSVTGITWDPWVDYYAGNLNSFAYTGTHMGYYVVDRQLGLTNPSGTEYGSGSLAELYTEYALEQITAYSTSARAEAFANYFDRCTFFPSHCILKPTHDSSINTYPCAAGTNNSETFEKADPNKEYTVTGIYINHASNLWWELISSSGKVGYMYGESARYVRTVFSDVTLSGATPPNGHGQGQTFSLNGTVSTDRCEITEISVWVHSGFDRDGTKVTGASAVPTGKSYNLKGSSIDNSSVFDQLAVGQYTYVIRANYRSYFISDNYELMYAYGTKTLLEQYFVVVPTAVSQSSCTHNYVTSTLAAADCTGKGSAVKYCSICGKLTTEIIPAYGHKYSSQTTIAATCTTDGYTERTCTTCGYEEKKVLPATGHKNILTETKATCVQRSGYAYICRTCSHSESVDLSKYQSQWLENIPEEFGKHLFAVRNQYRYRTSSSDEWSEWYDGVAPGYDDREVQTRTLYRMKAGILGDHSWNEGVCIHCGKVCNHSYLDNYCTICGYREPDNDLYLFGWINGANYACEEDADNTGAYKFVDGKLAVTFTERSYVAVKTGDNRIWYMTDGYPGDEVTSTTLYSTQITLERSDKLSVPKGRQITFTVVHNDDGSLTLSYEAADCEHDWIVGICRNCDTVCDHSVWTHGACGSCGLYCAHEHWTNGICNLCTQRCDHIYSDNLCTVCGTEKPPKKYYLFGYLNGRDYGCEGDYMTMGDYRFMDGTLTAIFTQDSYVAVKTDDNQDWYMADRWLGMDATGATLYLTSKGGYEKLFVPGGKVVTFRLIDNGNGTLTLTYETEDCPHETHDIIGHCTACNAVVEHDWDETVVDATCTAAGAIFRRCSHCGGSEYQRIPAKGHQLESSVLPPRCSIPGYTTHTCTVCGYGYTDSRIPATGHIDVLVDSVAPGCNTSGRNLYCCSVCGYQHTKLVPPQHTYAEHVTPPTCTQEGFTTYVCACGDSYLGNTTAVTEHQYKNGTCIRCGEAHAGSTIPTLTLKSPSLEFKDTICINAFYTAENIQDVVEMGMITYDEQVTTVSIDTADHIIPGAAYVESSDRYYASSQGIHAKYLGDTVYLAIYAKLTDGSYAYSKLASYSAVQYATSQLKNSTDVKLKKLVAAMLNYGAEAQMYFGHNVGSLANATLTADQKALPDTYRPDMGKNVPIAPVDKQGIFTNNSGFSARKPAVSFEGAFSINYFFTPKYAPDSGVTLYYWNEADYNAASVLTTANATDKIKLEGSGTSQYQGDITGISAKELSGAVYVAAAYRNGSNVWTSGVLGYSIGAYCGSQASKGTDFSALAMATAIYGYHAKAYFG